MMNGNSSSNGTSPNSPDDNGGNGESFPVAETIAAVLCFITVILAVSILILIIRKTRKRVIILSPPNVKNPHYNHLSVISDNSMKRFSLKRLSSKFSSSQKISTTPQDEEKLRTNQQMFPLTNLPRESLSSITSINIIPSLSGELVSYANSKESLLSSNGPKREFYFSLGTSTSDEVSSYGEIMDSDAIAYEIPERYEGFQNTYSQLTIPTYSVLSEEGVYVPSEDERNSNQAMYDHFESHRYNKLQFFEQNDLYWQPASTKEGLYSQLAAKKYREIFRKDVRIYDKLGSGNFASVYQGVWKHENRTVDVGIKILKTDSNQVDKIKFLQEAAIMGQFLHANIVRLLGVVTVEEPTMIVLELLTKGDLLSYLRKLNPTPASRDQDILQKLFLRFAREVAAGMGYLSGKSFIHRDLAARNILLSQQLTCKIGDFGMARDLINEGYYRSKGGKMPIKWTAPEALLFKKFSTYSDVWSYGIVLYEIWSLGSAPFIAFSNSDMISLAFSGLCHPPSPGLPRAIYQLMVDCWNPDHSGRPKFSEISSYLIQSDSHLLNWTDNDLAVSPMVNKLGVSHHESAGLYKDLQTMYKHFSTNERGIEQLACSSNLRRGGSLSTIPSPRILKTESLRDISHFKL